MAELNLALSFHHHKYVRQLIWLKVTDSFNQVDPKFIFFFFIVEFVLVMTGRGNGTPFF